MVLAELVCRLEPYGLILRGGFHPEHDEVGFAGALTMILVGNAGPVMWSAFAPEIDGGPDPLNRWTERVIAPVAKQLGAEVRYPFGQPYWPFQQWAQRAEGLRQSPLGLLIHPEYGLWHAYRAALLLPERIALPTLGPVAPHPCELCIEKPCLRACPVGAFSPAGYHVPACASHLATSQGLCAEGGCHARDACPVGTEWRYPPEQIRFHMEAFAQSVVQT